MKQFKLINFKTKKETICSLVTIDGFNYYISENTALEDDYFSHLNRLKQVSTNDGITLFSKDGYEYDPKYCKKLIATNNPNIDIPKIIDVLDNIIKNAFYDENGDFKRSTIGADDWVNGLKLGYNKVKELYNNTEEDMIKFANHVVKEDYKGNKTYTKELLDEWEKQQPIKLYYE